MVGERYLPLAEFLSRQTASSLCFTFEEIERLIGRRLPDSASNYAEWWSGNTPHRSQETAWLSVGWKPTKVDRERQLVTFSRI